MEERPRQGQKGMLLLEGRRDGIDWTYLGPLSQQNRACLDVDGQSQEGRVLGNTKIKTKQGKP